MIQFFLRLFFLAMGCVGIVILGICQLLISLFRWLRNAFSAFVWVDCQICGRRIVAVSPEANDEFVCRDCNHSARG